MMNSTSMGDALPSNALSARTLLSGVIGPKTFSVIESWLMSRRGEANPSALNGPLHEDVLDMVEAALLTVVTTGKRFPTQDGAFKSTPPTAETILLVYEALGFYLRAGAKPGARGAANLPSTSAIVLIHWLIEVRSMQEIDKILALDMIRRHALAVSEATITIRSRESANRLARRTRAGDRVTGFDVTTSSGSLGD